MTATNVLPFPAPDVTLFPKLSPVQREANRYQRMGLNVLPTFPATKKPAAYWKHNTTTPLATDPDLIALLFSGSVGVCAITGGNRNHVVLDCETGERLTDLTTKTELVGLSVFAVLSGSGKGGHLHFFCSDGQIQNVDLKSAAKRDDFPGDLELFGQPHIIVMPPSIHPKTGHPYSEYPNNTASEPPTATLEQLSAIVGASLTLASYSQGSGNPDAQTPSDETRRLIATGIVAGSTWEALQSAGLDLMGCANFGWMSHSDARQQWQRIDAQTGYSARHPQKFDALEKWIFSQTDATPQRARNATQSHSETRQHDRARAWVQSQQWHGKAELAERATALAFCELAARANRTPFRASYRELADVSGMSLGRMSGRAGKPGTVARLVARGFVVAAGNASGGASLWSFGAIAPIAYSHEHEHHILDCTLLAQFKLTGGIGQTGLDVLEFLHRQNAPQTAQTIADALNMPVKRIRDALSKKLKPFGLADNPQRGQWEATQADLTKVSRQKGLTAKHQRRMELRRRERVWRAIMAVVRMRAGDARPQERAAFLAAWFALRPTLEKRYHPKHTTPAKAPKKVLYCRECGQSPMFPDSPPRMCSFCKSSYADMWQAEPPAVALPELTIIPNGRPQK